MRLKLSSLVQFCLGFILVCTVAWAFPNPQDQTVAQVEGLMLSGVTSPVITHPRPAVYYGSEPVLKKRPDLARLIMVRALVLATYDTEGTYPNEDPYTLTYGYDRFKGFDSHPQKQVCRTVNGEQLCSDAAGACQFIYDTWIAVYNKYESYFLKQDPETGESIGKFAPINQDRACFLNYVDKGGIPDFLKPGNWGITDTGQIWVKQEAIDLAFMRLCAQWASFQCELGKGFGDSNGYYDRPEYGNQNAVPIEDTRKMYLTYLEQQEAKLGITPAASVAAAPAPAPAAKPVQPVAGDPESLFPEVWKSPAQKGETIAGFPITSLRGTRTDPISGASGAFHKGFDIAAPEGTPIYAFLAGKAVCIPDANPGQKAGPGNQIKFYPNAMPAVYFVMKHLTSCEDVVWDGVGDAPVIGKTGNTGYSTGPHLHFEKWVNGEHTDYPKGWIYMVFTGKMPGNEVANNVVKFDRIKSLA